MQQTGCVDAGEGRKRAGGLFTTSSIMSTNLSTNPVQTPSPSPVDQLTKALFFFLTLALALALFLLCALRTVVSSLPSSTPGPGCMGIHVHATASVRSTVRDQHLHYTVDIVIVVFCLCTFRMYRKQCDRRDAFCLRDNLVLPVPR